MRTDFLIVGAGFAGITLAERIASHLNKTVLLVERRNHIGGNAFDSYNDDGILVQKYGPHIFHTGSQRVWNYLSQFTRWNGYVHRVLARVNGIEVYLPVNLDTMEKLCGRRFTPKQLKTYFELKRTKLCQIKNARDAVVSQVGEQLYELFFKNYTKKQWGICPEDLDAEVTSRLPVRLNRDTRYFSDKYQGIPRQGYAKMFDRMLANPNIRILLNTDFKTVSRQLRFKTLIFTGPIDYFFGYAAGKLPYRSIKFSFRTLNAETFQNAGVVNFPNDHKYTRITEFKHLYFQKHPKTTICYEYPCEKGDPYYPIPNSRNKELYLRYKAKADKLKNVFFTGRLGQYKYMNMDHVVAESLRLFERIKNEC